MSVFAETRAAVALAAGLRSFLGQRLSVGQARDLIRQRLDRREDHFLGMLAAGIFTVPSSPYRPLLDMAGCSLGDIRASVRTRGIEATLRRLRDEGVYVTFEEFKGRKPIVRRGKAVAAAPSDFFSPLRNTHYWVETGGTTGSAMRVSSDLNRVAVSASYLSIAHHAYGDSTSCRRFTNSQQPLTTGAPDGSTPRSPSAALARRSKTMSIPCRCGVSHWSISGYRGRSPSVPKPLSRSRMWATRHTRSAVQPTAPSASVRRG